MPISNKKALLGEIMVKFETEQERFWAGEFGDEYVIRNRSLQLLAANIAFFSKILNSTQGVNTLIEFGANIGMNLQALCSLLPQAEFAGIEINESAMEELAKMERVKPIQDSIISFEPQQQYDFALIKGVLIHINPEHLQRVYENLYQTSSKYICVAEYYNPTPVEVSYRGHEDRLFKRDFAGEMLDIYSDLRLVDYGFSYHRDPNFPQDDISWFLLEKG